MFRQQRFTNDWENPKVVQRNKLPGRAPRLSFNSLADLDRGHEGNKLSLNGPWQFTWVRDLRNYREEEAARVSAGEDIEVPGVWQLQGYGIPYYLAFDYPPAIGKRKNRIPHIDARQNEVGIYTKEFTLPPAWQGKNIYLFFGGVKAALSLYVNGQKAGYSQGSMTPAEFDITQYVQEGTTKVVALVYRYSDGTYLEGQDMWYFSGIYRDVYLHCQPPSKIFDFFAYAGNGRFKNRATSSYFTTYITMFEGINFASIFSRRIHVFRIKGSDFSFCVFDDTPNFLYLFFYASVIHKFILKFLVVR